MPTSIQHADFVESIAAALQYISYYHPADYIQHLARAYEGEASPAAKDAIAQILTNSRMCAEGHRPICQDTGIVTVFVKWGQQCLLDSAMSLQEVVDEGVRRAYRNPENPLPHQRRYLVLDEVRAAMINEAAGAGRRERGCGRSRRDHAAAGVRALC